MITKAEFADAKKKLMKKLVDEAAPPPPGSGREAAEEAPAETGGAAAPATHYVPLGPPPAGASATQASCPAGYDITGVDEWIQGETTPDAGALTVFFFFSQSCHICHDVAPTLSKLHKKYKDRGLQVHLRPHAAVAPARCSLARPRRSREWQCRGSWVTPRARPPRRVQVVGIHATPKGFREPPHKIDELKQFIDQKKLAFSIVDTHSKAGDQPMGANGPMACLGRLGGSRVASSGLRTALTQMHLQASRTTSWPGRCRRSRAASGRR